RLAARQAAEAAAATSAEPAGAGGAEPATAEAAAPTLSRSSISYVAPNLRKRAAGEASSTSAERGEKFSEQFSERGQTQKPTPRLGGTGKYVSRGPKTGGSGAGAWR
ncbi:hypothetical protein KEM54_002753, partial [Ascosphaera aggregata]